jgi:hypothetical protein
MWEGSRYMMKKAESSQVVEQHVAQEKQEVVKESPFFSSERLCSMQVVSEIVNFYLYTMLLCSIYLTITLIVLPSKQLSGFVEG